MRNLVVAVCLFASTTFPCAAGEFSDVRNAAAHASARSAVMITDFSAAKRKRPPAPPIVEAPFAPVYPYWHGADPSYGPGTPQLRDLQRRGVCVIDEGYGRYRYCNND